MIKEFEQSNPTSCLNNACKNEMVFVLLARDLAAPYAIREWCKKRIELGKNTPNDPQILGALEAAQIMEAQQKYINFKGLKESERNQE